MQVTGDQFKVDPSCLKKKLKTAAFLSSNRCIKHLKEAGCKLEKIPLSRKYFIAKGISALIVFGVLLKVIQDCLPAIPLHIKGMCTLGIERLHDSCFVPLGSKGN